MRSLPGAHRLSRRVRSLWLNRIVASSLVPIRMRRRLVKWGGVDSGKCGILPGVRFAGDSTVTLGDYSFVNVGVTFESSAPIRIGRGVAIGPGVSLIAAVPTGNGDRAVTRSGSIEIGDGCWIGAGARIEGGVTIGAGCVIGAASRVVSDCEPDGLYVGVPARRLRWLDSGP